ncbi:hypothetical protein XA68_13458 [Ophiocordyceps unilateralis]|uniref:Uncharacterized protein n=1 Tax=Ophiocordyceps unilateralis TaxID=268505 RepID=A0A2A9PCH0_OPHUN|nr:hypothetical protein XA68_13458 [Ophiocordyceps unilateralis]
MCQHYRCASGSTGLLHRRANIEKLRTSSCTRFLRRDTVLKVRSYGPTSAVHAFKAALERPGIRLTRAASGILDLHIT